MIFRKKLRYVLVESTDQLNLDDPHVSESLRNAMLGFMGQLHYFKTNPQVAAQLDGNTFIVSVNRGCERHAILALSFIKELGGRRMGFYTLRTSGTIRSLKGRGSR